MPANKNFEGFAVYLEDKDIVFRVMLQTHTYANRRVNTVIEGFRV